MDNSPGWRWDVPQRAYLYWDGRRYTSKAREVAGVWNYEPLVYATGESGAESPSTKSDPRHARRMIGLIVAQVVVLIWGGWMLAQAEEKECEVSEFTYTDPGDLPWLPWLVLVVLAMAAYATQADVRWMKVTSVMGVIVAACTFPGVVACAGVANCAM